MSDTTKACNLTEREIEQVIAHNCSMILRNSGSAIIESNDKYIERINYLNKRLKAFKEPEKVEGSQSMPAAASGWGASA